MRTRTLRTARAKAIACFLILCGCSKSADDAPEPQDEDPRPVSDAIHEQLDKAREVENTLMDNKNRLDEAIEGATEQ